MKRTIWLMGLILTAGVMLTACGGAATGASAGSSGLSVQTLWRDHLACQTAQYDSPVWSADGKLIFYVARTGNFSIVHAVSSQGGADRQVTQGGVQPSPSPDGRWLLVFHPGRYFGPGSVYGLVDLAGGSERVIGDLGDRPVWSPDGKVLTYRPWSGPSIVSMEPDSGRTSVAVPAGPDPHAGDVYPLWSPDGTRIAFSSTRAGRPALFRMDAGGGDLKQLTAPGATCPDGADAFVRPVAWQPDGKALAYALVCGQDFLLEMVTADGAPVTGLSYLGRPVASAAWSPDGSHVLLNEETGGQQAIETAAADGSGLATLRVGGSDPQWSPDGRQITFVSPDTGGMQQVYLMRADGSGLRQLTDNPGGHVCPH